MERTRLAVLIDADTGSGAEAVAAALQDTRRARLFGSRTEAKVHIDTIIEVAGGAVRFLVADLRRANGSAIDGIGVKPDIPVDPAPLQPMTAVSDVACQRVISPSAVAGDPVVASAVEYLSSAEALPLEP